MIPDLFTPKEASAILKVRQSWLERQAAGRRIPFTMLGGSYRFTTAHLTQIIQIFETTPEETSNAVTVLNHSGPQKRKTPDASVSTTTRRLRPRPRRNSVSPHENAA